MVVGTETYQVSEADAWSHIAGPAVGKDISERIAQMRGPSPQFSLAKSLSRLRCDRPLAGDP